MADPRVTTTSLARGRRATRRGIVRLVVVLTLFAAIVLVAAPAAFAPPMPLPLLWHDTLQGSYTAVEYGAVATAPDGTTYAAGKASHPTEGYDLVLMKHKADGDRAWTRAYISTTHQDEQAVAVATSEAGIVATAGRYRAATGTWGVLVTAWSSRGKLLWVKRWARDPGGLASEARDVLVTRAGDVYVTGTTVRSGDADLFVGKYSMGGKLRWVKYVAGNAGASDQGNALAMDGSGNVYAAGWVTQAGTKMDYALVKYRPDGKRLWLRKTDWVASWDEWANDVAIRGAFVVAAGAGVDGDGDDIGSIARYDTSGKVWWLKDVDHGGAGDTVYTRVGVDRYGHLYAAGSKDFDIGQGNDAVLVRYEPRGDFDWEWYWRGTSDDDRAAGLAVTAEGDIYVAGYANASTAGYQLFVMKLYANSNWSAYTTWNSPGAADDGALALSLGRGGVCVAGSSGSAGLMMGYGTEPSAP